MSLMGRGKQDDAPGTPAASSSGSSGGSGFGNLTAFIDQGSEFEGKLSFKDTVRIDGRFSGEISSENTLVVGETGVIEADIHSPSVVVSGTVAGNVHASLKLVMHKTARLEGDVHTPCLVMEEGAMLNGRVDMSRSSGAKSNGGGGPNPGGAKPQDAKVGHEGGGHSK